MRGLLLGCCLLFAAPSAALAQQAVNAELLRLHDDLHLSPAQEAAWRDYTLAIAPNPQVEARHRATDELLPALPTPRRIALIEATQASDDADFRRQGQAVTAFYNQLDAGQQRIFDLDTLPANRGRADSDRTAPRPAYANPR